MVLNCVKERVCVPLDIAVGAGGGFGEPSVVLGCSLDALAAKDCRPRFRRGEGVPGAGEPLSSPTRLEIRLSRS